MTPHQKEAQVTDDDLCELKKWVCEQDEKRHLLTCTMPRRKGLNVKGWGLGEEERAALQARERLWLPAHMGTKGRSEGS